MRRKDRQVTDVPITLAIIEAADSCRLGMVDDSGPTPEPYIVALNHGYEPASDGSSQGTFWLHSAREGRKVDILKRNPRVCVQLDCDHEPVVNGLGCGWGMKYASVVAVGRARLVEDPEERRHGLDCLMGHYRRLWGEPSPPASGRPEEETAPRADAPGTRPTHYDEKVLDLTLVIRVDVESLTAKRKL